MRALPLALALLVPLACGSKDDDSSGDDSSGGTGSGGTQVSGQATEDSGVTEDSGATVTGDPMTSASSVTMTDPTAGPTSATTTATSETTTSASGPTSDPTTDPSASASDTTTGGGADEGATQLCVDTINMYRATIGLPALQRWTEAEDCADAECVSDGMSGVPHGAFGMCGEGAQNECPGWPGPPETMITGCLELMWNEGPGEDFNKHGHYINMSNPGYTRVACGFAEVNGQIWSVQNFQ